MRTKNIFTGRRLVALSLTLASTGLNGQAPGPLSTHDLDPFIVTGSATPRRSNELSRPVSVLSSGEIAEKQAASFGDFLKDLPGVHSSSFGAGASRPVIRGFDGSRIRVLESGLESMDVSETSPDHAVALEPFFVDAIEVLRGSGTLLYGSSAIGGVVNVIDRRIVRVPSEKGLSADLFGRFDSVSDGWSGGLYTTYQENAWAFALGGLARDQRDYRIPGYAEVKALREEHHDHDDHDDHEDHEEAVYGRLDNSFIETESGFLSLSWFSPAGTRLSMALTGHDSLYGVPGHAHHDDHDEDHHDEHDDHHDDDHDAHDGHDDPDEEGVFVDLRQRGVRLEFEHTLTGSTLKSLQGYWVYSDYRHVEMEGDAFGTRFDREGWEGRIEATHEWADGLPGVSGIQISSSDFKAEGEEAFTPPSSTDEMAVFMLQEWHLERLRLDGGLRLENRRIRAVDTGRYDKLAASVSGGLHYRWDPRLAAALSLNHSSRHPTATELYAEGPHAATRQYELGDPSLARETSSGLDATLFIDVADIRFESSAFVSYFRDYIYADPLGTFEDGLPVYQYTAVDAVFYGMESKLVWHAWHGGESELHLSLLHDWVRTDIRDSSEKLPRIPPMRVGGGVEYSIGGLTLRTDLKHAFKQDRTAAEELSTASFTDLSATLSYRIHTARNIWTLLLRGSNLLDEEIRYHTSALKDMAPMPGRGISAMVRVAF